MPEGYRSDGGALEKIRAAFGGYIAYCGRYWVDEEAGEVVHQVESSLYPNWVGSEQRRRYRIDGNRLTLQVVREKGGIPQIARMVWERTGA